MNMSNKPNGVGEVVTWTVRNAFIARTVVQETLEKHAIKIRVKKTRPCTYLRRAIQQALSDGAIRKIGETATEVGYAVIEEKTDLRTVDYHSTVTEAVKLNKVTGDIVFRTDTTLTRQIRDGISKQEGGLLSNEIGGVLKSIVTNAANGIALRDTGGVYFVPAACTAVLDRAEVAIAECKNAKSEVRLHRLRVLAGSREASDLRLVYAEAVQDEVTAIKKEAVTLLQDLRKAKPSTFVKRAKDMSRLLKQLIVYEDALGGLKFDAERERIKKVHALLKQCAEKCIAARAKERAK